MEYIFTVKRNRGSVTQGGATVYLNGIEMATFGDDIELISEGKPYYGENIGGWASKLPDGAFVHGTLFHPHENLYHLSDKVREYLKGESDTASKPVHIAQPGRMYIDIIEKIASAETQEEKDAWAEKRSDVEKYGVDFCAGWHVGIYKQACGHWEILQSPIYINHDGTPAIINGKPFTAMDADREMREESKKRLCTRCVYERSATDK